MWRRSSTRTSSFRCGTLVVRPAFGLIGDAITPTQTLSSTSLIVWTEIASAYQSRNWSLCLRLSVNHKVSLYILVLCEYSKLQIKSNSYLSIRFDLKWVQLFKIFKYLPSPVSYLSNRMTPIYHLNNQAYQPRKWPTKYWNSYNRNHNSAVP